MLTVRLPEELERRLSALARKTGLAKAYIAREAIIAHLEDLEDAYLAETRLVEFVRSGAAAIPLEEPEPCNFQGKG